jgi:glycosyltransferase involved in cell wall biosynthesis
VVVVDDASSDDTPDVLQEFGDSVRVFRSDRNLERGAARNMGARLATGEILAFLDSDDEWKPGKLTAQLPHVLEDHASVTGIELIDEAGRALGRTYSPPPDAHHEILLSNPYLGSPSSLVLPSSLFHRAGGFPEDRELQGSEDWLFLVKLIRTSGSPIAVSAPLVRYRVHGLNSTADPRALERSMWAAVEWLEASGYATEASVPRARARAAAAIGRAFAAKREWGAAAGWALRAARHGTAPEAARAIAMIARSGVGALRPGTPSEQ